MKRRILAFIVFVGLLIFPAYAKDVVYTIKVDENINSVTVSKVREAVAEAENIDAKKIIFEINSTSGYLKAAEEISDILGQTTIETSAFINKKAESAAAIVVGACDEVYMVPGAHITIDSSSEDNEANEIRSTFLTSNLANKNQKAFEKITKTENTSLNTRFNLSVSEAKKYGLIENTITSVKEIVKADENYEIKQAESSLINKFFDLLINPYFNTLLIVIGFVGAIVELFLPGFGLGGILSILSFALFFLGNIASGHAQWFSLLIFCFGSLLLFIELLVPGFGIMGISGIGLIFLGLIQASSDIYQGMLSLSIAIIVSVITSLIIVKKGFKSEAVERIVLRSQALDEDENDKNNIRDLVGKRAWTVSILRPSGTIFLEGKRMDALSEGEFIAENVEVEVIRIVGSKIFVRRVV